MKKAGENSEYSEDKSFSNLNVLPTILKMHMCLTHLICYDSLIVNQYFFKRAVCLATLFLYYLFCSVKYLYKCIWKYFSVHAVLEDCGRLLESYGKDDNNYTEKNMIVC